MSAAHRITDDMLIAAAAIDDLDAAVKSVMDQVGIDTGDVASMVFNDIYQEDWPEANVQYRLAMLRDWRDVEQMYDLDYPLSKEKP